MASVGEFLKCFIYLYLKKHRTKSYCKLTQDKFLNVNAYYVEMSFV